MKRRTFLPLLGLAPLSLAAASLPRTRPMLPEKLFFKDDGAIPNSRYPALLYRQAFAASDDAGATWLERRFAENNWTNSWRNGVYAFHHYHSTSHEVLGIYAGSALLHLGGEAGQKVAVQAGDILVLPAGVGHKNLGGSHLGVVGAYPDGRSWDVNRGLPGERPRTDNNIAALPLPTTDPLLGKAGGLLSSWQ
jgi:uncharacterized protein YjlB